MKKKKKLQQRTYKGVEADLRIEDRKRRMIAAGIELFGTIGYAGTSIKRICEQAGLTERYFYESFACKEDLLIRVYQEIVAELDSQTFALIDQFADQPVDIPVQTLRRYLRSLQDDPRIARILFFEILGVSPRIDRLYQRAIQKLSDNAVTIFEKRFHGMADHQISDTIYPAAIAGAIIQVASQWVLSGFQPPLETIVAQADRLFRQIEQWVTSDLN